MIKVLIIVLAWIALTSCAKPDSEKTCGYVVQTMVIGDLEKCLTEPAQRPDGLFQCVNHESKLIAFGNVAKIQEGCW